MQFEPESLPLRNIAFNRLINLQETQLSQYKVLSFNPFTNVCHETALIRRPAKDPGIYKSVPCTSFCSNSRSQSQVFGYNSQTEPWVKSGGSSEMVEFQSKHLRPTCQASSLSVQIFSIHLRIGRNWLFFNHCLAFAFMNSSTFIQMKNIWSEADSSIHPSWGSKFIDGLRLGPSCV